MSRSGNKGPFKFLAYYEESDAKSFGGRDREVAEIVSRVTQTRTHILYGRSGLGKTSLLLAGVFPQLRERGWTPVHVRTLANPAADLLRSLRAELGSSPVNDSNRPAQDTVQGFLRALPADVRVLLTFDQFEEFFIRFRDVPQVRAEFVALIATIARDPKLPVHVLFSLREDFLAEMDDFRTQLPTLFEDEYRLRAMTAYGVRQAVTRPLEAAGVEFEPRFVTRLIDQLAQSRLEPIVLQILSDEVYRRARGRDEHHPRLLEADLQSVGDIDLLFRQYLDRATGHLDAHTQLVARIVLHNLTTQERTKQALRLESFTTAFARISAEEAQAVLDVLVTHRLVRADPRGTDTWYELTHERLVEIVTPWLRLDTEFNKLIAADDLIATSVRSRLWRDGPENLLAAGHLTDVVGPFRDRLRLSDEELEFVVRSASHCQYHDFASWAAAYDEAAGVGATEELLLELLASSNDAVRRGAAHAVRQCSEPGEKLRARLVDLALTDPDEQVRRTAGASMGRLGMAGLRALLRERGSTRKKEMLSAMADMLTHGDSLADVPWWLRRRAQDLAETRVVEEHREKISKAGRSAVLGALGGGLAWLVLMIPYLLLWVFASAADTGEPRSSEFAFSLVVLFVALGIFLGFGWAAGKNGAVRAVARRRQWGAAVATSRAYLSGFLIIVGSFFWIGDAFDVIGWAMLLVSWMTIAIFVPLARPMIAKGDTGVRACGWPAVCAMGTALPCTLALDMLLGASLEFATAGAVTASCMTATVGGALARVGASDPSLMLVPEHKQVRRARAVATTLAGLSFAASFAAVGPGIIPWQPSEGALSAGDQITIRGELDPRGPIPAIQHHVFHVNADEPSNVKISGTRRVVAAVQMSWSKSDSLDSDFNLFDVTVRVGNEVLFERESVLLLVAEGRHEIAVRSKRKIDYQLELQAQDVLPAGPITVGNEPVHAWSEWEWLAPGHPNSFGSAIIKGTAEPGRQVVVSLPKDGFLIDDPRGAFGNVVMLWCNVPDSPPYPLLKSELPRSLPRVAVVGTGGTIPNAACVTPTDSRGDWEIELSARSKFGPVGREFPEHFRVPIVVQAVTEFPSGLDAAREFEGFE